MASIVPNAKYATEGYPFTRTISEVEGLVSVQTRYIEEIWRYGAFLISPTWRETQIAVSSDGEDWNTFFTRVLDILSASQNDAVRTCVIENREKWLREAVAPEDEVAPEEAAPEE